MPACHHLSVSAEAVPAVAYFCPLIYNTASVIQEEVPAVVYLSPALGHRAIGLQIIIYRDSVIGELKPARLKLSARGIQIIPFIGDIYPACFHNAVIAEVVPDIVNLCPALLHISVITHVIIYIGAVVIHTEPVACDNLSVLLIIVITVALLPARKCRD